MILNTTRHLVTSNSNLRDLRWSIGQMVAHLASSGSGLQTGDLVGTGTISSLVRENMLFNSLGSFADEDEESIATTTQPGLSP
jgi:fumarylacetoacetase